MERRDFLLAGAAGAAAAGSSCATLPIGEGVIGSLALSPSEMTDYLARVDRGMAAIQRGTILPRTQRLEASPAEREVAAREEQREEQLAKQGLRALLFTSAYNDLDAAGRNHPEVQKRLAEVMPEVDEAVLGMTGTIAELSPERAAAVQRVLREDPGVGLAISEQLDRPARLVDVPLKRRLQMRSMLTHFAWRMRVQSPTVVADEYLTKMHRVAALGGRDEELRRALATRLTGEAFWRYQDRVAQASPDADEPGASRPARDPGPTPPTPPAAVPAPPVAEPPPITRIQPLEGEPRPNRGRGVLLGGAITMSIGAVVFGVGAGLVFGAGEIAGAFMMTFGGIGVLVGLILLIVGAVLRSRS
jgi:hypothetical protein